MFGLFKAKPPLDPWEKAWTENRLSWMSDHFGMTQLLDTPTLVPDYAGIPDANNEAEATELLEFVMQWMRLDMNAHLQVFSESDTVATIGVAPADGDSVPIRIMDSHFRDPETIIAFAARQLAESALAETAVADEGWAIDLFPVFCGLGFFAANANVRAAGKSDGLSWWTSLQRGYLPARIFGYALALRTSIRGDSSDEWSQQLRPDALATYGEGLKYLQKTRDAVFSRDLLTKPRSTISEMALLDELRTGSPSRKISAMWALNKRNANEPLQNPQLTDLLIGCLRHKEPEVRAVAASSLPRYSRTVDTAHDLTDALKDRNEKVRIAAAEALREFIGIEQEMVVEELTHALNDDVRLVVFNAAKSLTAFGTAAEPAAKMLLKRLRRSLNECNEEESRTILWAINAIVEDPQALLADFFDDSHAEYLTYSIELLAEMNGTESVAE